MEKGSELKEPQVKKKRIISCSKIKQWLKINRHERPRWILQKLNEKLTGYFNYYGVTDNGRAIQKMRQYVTTALFKTLRRRSNKNKLTWISFEKMMKAYPLRKALVRVNIYNIISTIAIEKL